MAILNAVIESSSKRSSNTKQTEQNPIAEPAPEMQSGVELVDNSAIPKAEPAEDVVLAN